MKLIDLNLLLYAVNADSPCHTAAKGWLEEALNAPDPVAIPWVVVLGFLRIATNPRILERPLLPEQALAVVDAWLTCPGVRILEGGEGHWPVLKALISDSGTAGNLTTDAHLAALAITHGCRLCSTDRDFGRFAGLQWVNPLS